MSLELQYNVTVKLDETPLGTWDKLSGGEVDSEETKFKPGGMAPEVSLGGSQSVGNVTVSKLYSLVTDHPRVPAIRARVGKGDVTVTKQPLDVDGNAFGEAIVYLGKLKTMTLPDHDSTSSDPAMIELEVSSARQI